MNLKVRRLRPGALLPTKAKAGDAGWDLFFCPMAAGTHEHTIPNIPNPIPYHQNPELVEYPSHDLYIIPTGLAMEIPDGYFLKIESRSGLARNFGAFCTAGVIDAGFRGELHVLLVVPQEWGFDFFTAPHHAHGYEKRVSKRQDFKIEPGQKVAQALLLPVPVCGIEEVQELSTSERGESGWGSSG